MIRQAESDSRGGPRFGAALAAVAGAALILVAGCIGPMNVGSVRAGASLVRGNGYDLRLTDDGEAFGVEFARGTDQDPAMGPIYFAFAYSCARMDTPRFDDTYEHRAGTRWRSSVLEEVTSSYPYAAVGIYVAWIEPGNERGGRLGAGVEGGYGLRFGLGNKLAFDIEAMASYGFFDGRYEAFSSRLGGALVWRF